MFGSFLLKNLVGLSQPGSPGKAELPTAPPPPPLRLRGPWAAGQEPSPWALRRTWAGHATPQCRGAQAAGVKSAVTGTSNQHGHGPSQNWMHPIYH